MHPDQVRESVRQRYEAVAREPAGQFAYPVGRASAEGLGYRRDFLDRIPPEVVARFVGVGNPFAIGEPARGVRVVDVGCGAGLDSRMAALHVGPEGRVIGVDLSAAMLAVAREGRVEGGPSNVEFRLGDAEALPVESGWADLVISNGVLNLATCKPTAFAEVARVLKPGGTFQAADLVLVGDLPDDLRDDQFAWSR